MLIQMKNGLPIVALSISYKGKAIVLSNVLFDTGCASTVFDTDLMASIGLHLDFIHGTAKRMYGVGGTSEICYEQSVQDIKIDTVLIPEFILQLGSTYEPYGFDGILGIDYMLKTGLKVDFTRLTTNYPQE